MTQVTIIGAGPTGLIAAATLVKSGVAVRIFEKKAHIDEMSKALAIHAGTLEILEATHPQLLQKILAHGIKLDHAFFGKNKLDLKQIPSKYNFVLSLEQGHTEHLLEEYLASLGVKVEREIELLNLTQNSHQVIAGLAHKNGRNFFVESDYLIDCGGAHSTARHLLNIQFKGEKYLGHMVMGDFKVNTPWAQDSLRLINAGEQGFAGILPIPGGMVRLILVPFKDEIELPVTINHFTYLAKKLAPQIEIVQNFWLTDIQVHKRLAEKFRVGRIFLAGDAAHIHSPVGGQGMNMGLHDAVNIANKLQKVLNKKTPEKILDLYEKERRPVIKQVLRLTDRAMKSGIDNKLSVMISKLAIKIITPIFFACPFLQKKLLILLSEVGSARKEIARL